MSAASDLSSQPLSADSGQGVLSGMLRLNAAGATPITFPVGNSGYAGLSVRNNNATQWVRVNLTLLNSVVGDTQMIVRPGNNASVTFDQDAITAASVEVIQTPAVGFTSGATATPAVTVTGNVDVDLLFVNQ